MAKKKYTPRELMELAVKEMRESKSEHKHKPDPFVGAVLSKPNGEFVMKAHRGELRKGDHAEFTLFEKKLLSKRVQGYTLYTTLEPCIDRTPPKDGCTFRIISARIGKVVIGHLDPDPTVSGVGVELLKKEGIEIEYFDKDLEEIIDKVNDAYFREKEKLAKQLKVGELRPVTPQLEEELTEFELDDFSEEAQNEMINRMELPFKLVNPSFLKFLAQFGFIKIGKRGIQPKPTGLGLLLLGKNPQYHFPQARIKFTIFRKGQDDVIKTFEGPLVLLPGRIEEYLDVLIQTEISREKFARIESSDIPKKALREVIINAIVHRDYILEGHSILINVYNNRIEIFSPGIPRFPLEKFYTYMVPPVSRNQKIAYIFNQMHWVEERGLGMKELKELKDSGYPPVFKFDDNFFITVLYRQTIKGAPDIPKEPKGLKELRIFKELTTSKYMEIVGIPERTARRHLNDLIKLGYAESFGEGPSRGYRFIKR